MDRAVPYFAALILDAVDLATFGPLGLWVGFILGSITGWFLSDSLGFKPTHRWMAAVLGGVYCMMPGTGILPVATIVTALRNFGARSEARVVEPAAGQDRPTRKRVEPDPLVVEYREVDDEELR